MPYKDPEKRREANREAQQRYRNKRAPRYHQKMYIDEAMRVLGLEYKGKHRQLFPSEAVINKAYIGMVATVHPDRSPGTDGGRLVKLATDARETLRFWKTALGRRFDDGKR